MSRFSRRQYSDRERMFYSAKRLAKSGYAVLCEYANGKRDRVSSLATRDGVQMVETIAGWTSDFTNLLTFQRVTDAINALHENKTA